MSNVMNDVWMSKEGNLKGRKSTKIPDGDILAPTRRRTGRHSSKMASSVRWEIAMVDIKGVIAL